jgi:hypothetical protein
MQLQISCSMICMAGIGILHDLRHIYMDKKDYHLSRAMGILILPNSGPSAHIGQRVGDVFRRKRGGVGPANQGETHMLPAVEP